MPEVNPIIITYQAPFKGKNSSLPENVMGQEFSPSLSNVILKNGEIRSRPRISPLITGTPDGFPLRGIVSFIDANNVVHTCGITKIGFYQLSSNWFDSVKQNKSPWALVQQFDKGLPDVPVSHSIFINKLYFTNGNDAMYSWDGMSNSLKKETAITSFKSDGTVLGTGFAGGYYLMELDAHLILANVIETIIVGGVQISTHYPQRTRWCSSGNPSNWDTATDIGAGFNDSLDTPDGITGVLPLGRVGYLFRTNGVTEIVPVSGGVKPFDYYHLWAADRGIGNVYAQTLAGFGVFGIFISSEGVYKLGVNSLDSIGDSVIDSILTDIFESDGLVLATIVPYLSPSYPYPAYWLTVPKNGSTKHWLYNIKEDSWTNWRTENKLITTRPRYVFTG